MTSVVTSLEGLNNLVKDEGLDTIYSGKENGIESLQKYAEEKKLTLREYSRLVEDALRDRHTPMMQGDKDQEGKAANQVDLLEYPSYDDEYPQSDMRSENGMGATKDLERFLGEITRTGEELIRKMVCLGIDYVDVEREIEQATASIKRERGDISEALSNFRDALKRSLEGKSGNAFLALMSVLLPDPKDRSANGNLVAIAITSFAEPSYLSSLVPGGISGLESYELFVPIARLMTLFDMAIKIGSSPLSGVSGEKDNASPYDALRGLADEGSNFGYFSDEEPEQELVAAEQIADAIRGAIDAADTGKFGKAYDNLNETINGATKDTKNLIAIARGVVSLLDAVTSKINNNEQYSRDDYSRIGSVLERGLRKTGENQVVNDAIDAIGKAFEHQNPTPR